MRYAQSSKLQSHSRVHTGTLIQLHAGPRTITGILASYNLLQPRSSIHLFRRLWKSRNDSYGSTKPPGNYDVDKPREYGSDTKPYDNKPPGSYDNKPPGSYDNKPPGSYDNKPPNTYGTDKPSGYGSGTTDSYGDGTKPPGSYGGKPPTYDADKPSGYGSSTTDSYGGGTIPSPLAATTRASHASTVQAPPTLMAMVPSPREATMASRRNPTTQTSQVAMVVGMWTDYVT